MSQISNSGSEFFIECLPDQQKIQPRDYSGKHLKTISINSTFEQTSQATTQTQQKPLNMQLFKQIAKSPQCKVKSIQECSQNVNLPLVTRQPVHLIQASKTSEEIVSEIFQNAKFLNLQDQQILIQQVQENLANNIIDHMIIRNQCQVYFTPFHEEDGLSKYDFKQIVYNKIDFLAQLYNLQFVNSFTIDRVLKFLIFQKNQTDGLKLTLRNKASMKLLSQIIKRYSAHQSEIKALVFSKMRQLNKILPQSQDPNPEVIPEMQSYLNIIFAEPETPLEQISSEILSDSFDDQAQQNDQPLRFEPRGPGSKKRHSIIRFGQKEVDLLKQSEQESLEEIKEKIRVQLEEENRALEIRLQKELEQREQELMQHLLVQKEEKIRQIERDLRQENKRKQQEIEEQIKFKFEQRKKLIVDSIFGK